MSLSLEPLSIEARNVHPYDCPDCGKASLTVSGLVSALEEPVAADSGQWTPGERTHDADFDLVLGTWGDGTGPGDRPAVTLSLRHLETGPAFMVVDAAVRRHADGALAAVALKREDVLGTPIAQRAFLVVDAIWSYDERIEDLKHA